MIDFRYYSTTAMSAFCEGSHLWPDCGISMEIDVLRPVENRESTPFMTVFNFHKEATMVAIDEGNKANSGL